LIAAGDLGYYSVPRNITLQVQFLVNPIATRVGFPVIASVQQDAGRVRSVYMATLNATTSAFAPIYVGSAFFSYEILFLLLGSQWDESAELFRLLSVWAALRATGNPMGSLLLGMGKANWALLTNFLQICVQLPLLWVGASYGTGGLVWSMVLFQGVVYLPRWYFLVRALTDMTLVEYSSATLKPVLLATAAIYPAYFAAQFLESPVARLVAGVLLSAPLYVILSYLGNREWVLQMTRLLNPKESR
jgi:O-antigen/teichoic acid export membrane protein